MAFSAGAYIQQRPYRKHGPDTHEKKEGPASPIGEAIFFRRVLGKYTPKKIHCTSALRRGASVKRQGIWRSSGELDEVREDLVRLCDRRKDSTEKSRR
jgi:hypothetical protein